MAFKRIWRAAWEYIVLEIMPPQNSDRLEEINGPVPAPLVPRPCLSLYFWVNQS